MAWADRPSIEQAALNYCAPRGIPLTVFLYGRVVYPGDPMWSDTDCRAALDWDAKEKHTCPGCGQPVAECMAHEDDAPAYEVELRRCHACKVRGIEERVMSRDGDPGPGLYAFVRKAAGSN